MSATKEHFQRELAALQKLKRSGQNTAAKEVLDRYAVDVRNIVDKFCEDGHSGGSANVTAMALSEVIKAILLQMPIAPVEDDPDSWSEPEPGWEQHKRCGNLLRFEGKAMYNDAIIFVDEEGSTFTGVADGVSSAQEVMSFPFIPKNYFVKVTSEKSKKCDPQSWLGEDGKYYKFKIKDKRQLDQVWQHYKKPEDL